VDVKMGPDGAIYIADWYNPIIQHGEVDFRDPRRDTAHGRIWRIAATNRPLVKIPISSAHPSPDLLEALRLPEQFTRERARAAAQAPWRRHGAARAAHVGTATWIRTRCRSCAASSSRRCGSRSGSNAPQPDLLDTALRLEDFRVRAGAVRVASDWSDTARRTLPSSPGGPCANPHPRVRLEAVNALRLLGTAEAAQRRADGRWSRARCQPRLRAVADAARARRSLAPARRSRIQAFSATTRHALILALRSAGQARRGRPAPARCGAPARIPAEAPGGGTRGRSAIWAVRPSCGTLFELAVSPETADDDRHGHAGCAQVARPPTARSCRKVHARRC
jgi:hypothetical protein